MPTKSIQWPPRIVQGRLAWTADPAEANRQAIRLALLRGPSGNPFEDAEGLPEFEPLARTSEAAVRVRIESTFRELERARRARLVGLVFKAGAGELIAVVDYVDLETTRRDRMELSIP